MREKAYSVLVLAMDQSTSHLIMNCESGNAHEVWEHLLQHFQRKTLASKLALKQAFHSQRMGNKSFSEYSEGIVQISNRLRQMGCTVEEDDKLAALFMGLNEEYEPIKISLMSRTLAPTFAEACAALADYSLQKSLETNKGASRGETAFYIQDSTNSTQSKTPRRETRKCYNCNQKGHLSRDCKQKRKNEKSAAKSGQGGKSFKAKCLVCKKKGHKASDCRLLKRAQHMSQETTNLAEENKSDNAGSIWDEFSYMAVESTSDEDCGNDSASGCIASATPSAMKIVPTTAQAYMPSISDEDCGNDNASVLAASATATSESVPVKTANDGDRSDESKREYATSEIGNNKRNAKSATIIGQVLISEAHSEMLNGESKCRNSPKIQEWILDSGATSHICNDINLFSEFAVDSDIRIGALKGSVAGLGRGTIILDSMVKGERRLTKLYNVILVPESRKNIISISKLCDQPATDVIFSKKKVTVLQGDVPMLQGYRTLPERKLYILLGKALTSEARAELDEDDVVLLGSTSDGNTEDASSDRINGGTSATGNADTDDYMNSDNPKPECEEANETANETKPVFDEFQVELADGNNEEATAVPVSRKQRMAKLWHQRLGHINMPTLAHMAKGHVTGMDAITGCTLDFCSSCVYGKHARKSLKKPSVIKTTRPLQLIHMDIIVVGVASMRGSRYTLLLVDDYSRYVWVRFLPRKSDTTAAIIETITYEMNVQEQRVTFIGWTRRAVHVLRTDAGGEFTSAELQQWCRQNGIKQQYSNTDRPAQNGVSERWGRVIAEIARTLSKQAQLPDQLWPEAYNTAAYTANRLVTRATGHTPYELRHSDIPDVSHMRVFGCNAYVRVLDKNRKKLDSKSKRCMMLGYSEGRKGYRLWDPASQSVIHSIDVIFDEDTMFYTGDVPIMTETTSPPHTVQPEPPVRKLGTRKVGPGSQPAVAREETRTAVVVASAAGKAAQIGESEVIVETETSVAAAAAPHTLVGEPAAAPHNLVGEPAATPHTLMASTSPVRTPTTMAASLMPLRSALKRQTGERDGMAAGAPKKTMDIKTNDDDAGGNLTRARRALEMPAKETKSSVRKTSAPPRRSARTNKGVTTSKRFEDEVFIAQESGSINEAAFVGYVEAMGASLANNVFTPSSYEEAVTCDDHVNWIRAMDEELQSLISNKTWRVVQRPGGGRKVIKCKWVYKVKVNSDGSVERYKARLVAKGFEQKEGVDYLETYAPVARMETIRLLLAVAARFNLDVTQLDFKTAFLYGELKNVEIYMRPPRGYSINEMQTGTEAESMQDEDETSDQESGNGKCLLLIKGLYGLKQAGREWNTKLNEALISFGFTRSKSDLCLYFYQQDNIVMVLTVWVDDVIAAHNSMPMWNRLIHYLRKSFKVTNMGECTWVLGMKLKRSREEHTLHISQELHLENILKRFNMDKCKPVAIPMLSKPKLRQQQEGETLTAHPYRSVVGALMYLAVCTRPDISYAVGQLARYCSAPTETHWSAAMYLLRYLKGTAKDGLLYQCKDALPILRMFSDSDWASCEDTRRSCTGYVSEFANATITWCSRMQSSVKDSTLYAEYTALSEALKDVLWLRHLLSEIKLEQRDPTTMFQDNQGTIAFSKNPRVHKRTKHIDVKHHMIREHIEDDVIRMEYIPSADNKADIFTKPLKRVQFCTLRYMISVNSYDEVLGLK